jgi:hypothetical protein
LDLVDSLLARAERLDLLDVVTELIMRRGMLLGQLGRNYESMAVTKGALELAEANGFLETAMSARGNLGYHYAEREPAKALALDRASVAEARRLGMRQRMLLILGNASEEARFTGDWDWAIETLALELAGELDTPDRAWFAGNTLVFRAWRGEASDDEWATWEALTEGDDDPQTVADYLDVRAVRALAEGRLADARRLAIDASLTTGGRIPSRRAVAARAALWSRDRKGAADDLAAIDESGFRGPAIELRRATIRAGVAALDGRPTEAIALYRSARDGWRGLDLPWEEALLGIDMVTLLDAREPDVAAAAARSREILVGLRAQPFIERLDAELGRDADLGRGDAPAPARHEAGVADRSVV